MNKIVPLHCLIIAVGASPAGRDRAVEAFPSHEIIREADLRRDLVGTETMPGLTGVVRRETLHRVALKLSLGERVVVAGANLRRDDRMELASVAASTGAPVFYLVCPEDSDADERDRHTFRCGIREIMRGDGIAEVIDGRLHSVAPVLRWPDLPFEHLSSRFSGLTVFADVHGMYQALCDGLRWARSRNHAILFLGDVVDYGPRSLDVVDTVYDLVMRGEAAICMGNHERKISRWLEQREKGNVTVRLSEGNRATADALLALDEAAQRRWIGRFRAVLAQSRHRWQIGNTVFTHGAAHPDVWTGGAGKMVEAFSFFGEVDQTRSDGEYPCRIYNWCEAVPADMMAMVGHDIRSTTSPLVVKNEMGGQTVFLDLGAGKGGPLASADLKFAGEGLRVANFNLH